MAPAPDQPPAVQQQGAFVELQVELGEPAGDVVAGALGELTDGIEIRDQDTLLRAPPGRVILVVLVAPEGVAAVRDGLDQALAYVRAAGVPVDPVIIRERAAHEDEWRDVWKQFFRATRIGRRFVVRPSWDAGPVEAADHIIDLDPGRAFGTGAHPTTRLVIAMAEDLHDGESGPQVASFLDLGCGSGILSIAAARLWPDASGLAIDNDPEATACSAENFERNKVARVATRTGVLDDATTPVDLVLANIQADVLIPLAPRLFTAVRPGGRVLLSGILVEQMDAVARAFGAAGFSARTRRDDGEWSGLHVSRTA